MKLDKLPSIIRDTEFDKSGLAHVGSEILVPAYIGSQWGFNSAGKRQLDEFYGRLRKEARVLPLCPFQSCEEYLDFERLAKIESEKDSLGDYKKFWTEFNEIIGPVNYGILMPKSKFMIALFDGAHGVDDGLAAEIGFYAAKYDGKKQIFGIRSDFRLAENIVSPINIAVRYFLDQGPYNGKLFLGNQAYDEAIKGISEFTDAKIRSAA